MVEDSTTIIESRIYHKRKNNIFRLISWSVTIACFLFSCILLISTTNSISYISDIEYYHDIAGFMGLFLMLFMFITYNRLVGEKMSLFSLFIVSFYLFSMSQTILYLFGFQSETATPSIYKFIDYNDIVIGAIYTNMCSCALFMGALICTKYRISWKSKTGKATLFEEKEQHIQNKILRKAALAIAAIMLIPSLYYLINIFSIARSVGYDAILASDYAASTLTRISRYALSCFTVSLFGLIITGKEKDSLVKLSFGFLICLILYYFIIGERSIPASIVLVLIWYKSLSIKGQGLKSRKLLRMIKYIILIFFMIILFPLIQIARSGRDGLLSLEMLISAFTSYENSVIKAFLESISVLGYSATSFIYTYNFVPALTSFRFGTTYFWGATTILPNIFGIFGQTHIGAVYSGLSKWLMDMLGINWGPGFSLVAEAYINFGYMSAPFLILYGYFLAMILTPKVKSGLKGGYSSIQTVMVMALFVLCITLPRREFSGFVREAVYSVTPLYIMVKVYIHKYLLSHKKIG